MWVKNINNDTEIPPATDKILIYPNPVKYGWFYCTAPVGQNIRIYGMAGSLLKSCIIEENHVVDVSDLRPGVYFVTGKNFSHKIIISGGGFTK